MKNGFVWSITVVIVCSCNDRNDQKEAVSTADTFVKQAKRLNDQLEKDRSLLRGYWIGEDGAKITFTEKCYIYQGGEMPDTSMYTLSDKDCAEGSTPDTTEDAVYITVMMKDGQKMCWEITNLDSKNLALMYDNGSMASFHR